MNLLEHSPRFSADSAVQFAKENYGIVATATPLPSERDQNFLLETDAGKKFVLKIANSLEDRAMLEAQQQAMTHISKREPISQRVVQDRIGNVLTTIRSASSEKHFVQLVTYLPGIPLGEVHRRSPELLRDLGRSIGRLDRVLASFDHPAIHRNFHWDLANGVGVFRKYQSLIEDAGIKELANQIISDFERNTAPLLPKLRTSAIHNDANDFNVIAGGGTDLYTRNQTVVGVIDFGDMVHSYTVGDLAVAVAYAILNESDPLTAAAQIVKGYNEEYLLREEEIVALFGFICLRLCMSVSLAAHQQRQRPEDAYLTISQTAIRKILPKLAQIPFGLAEAVFRDACDRPAVANSGPVVAWLRANASKFAPVLNEDLRTAPCVVFDLSVGSSLVSGDSRENEEPELTKRLFSIMKAADVRIGVGRYDEPRLIYVSPIFATGEDFSAEHRVIHLAIDLFAEAGTPVHAPLSGTIHAFANNLAPQDYGPVLLLRHQTDDGHVFYTLYGHLSVESLEGWSVGKVVAKGEKIASIGKSDVNGGWTPHVHFQVITDLLDLDCEFPGVGRASQREIWRSFSPDPNLILGIPAERFPPNPPSKAETLAVRRARIGENLSLAYKEPLKIVRGWKQYLYSEDSRRYLDAYNNVPHVGHCHPKVIRAASEQMSVLNTNTRYLHDNINLLAERICATLPDPLRVCFFVNSGSEANELALRLAQAHTGGRDMVVLEAAYHGNTTSLIDISPYKHNGPGGHGAPGWVHVAPLPDVYRGHYKRDDSNAGEKYAVHVSELIQQLKKSDIQLAGFIAESCPSVGGQILFPDGYLRDVYLSVRKAGGVCIADEIQTGYGRIGTHFWGFESQGVVPDIVAMGKPIGNGHPLGAVVTTREIAASFSNGMEFFSTFGGNTVSCAIGLAVLAVVLEENLMHHALTVGNQILGKLRELPEKYPIIGDVRGSGLFLGVELVRDRISLQPAAEEASFISNRMRDLGILLGTDGPDHNVIKIRPPMPFSTTDADFLVAMLNKILAEDFQGN